MPAGDGLLDDLFGAPDAAAEPADADDLFAPPADEAVEEPATDAPAADDLDDLFGSPAGDASDNFDDLFGARATNHQQTVSVEVRTSVDPLAAAQQRVWVDNTGSFSTEGRLVEVGTDFIRLLKSNGRTCTVPMSRLSADDAAYIQAVSDHLRAAKLAMLSAR